MHHSFQRKVKSPFSPPVGKRTLSRRVTAERARRVFLSRGPRHRRVHAVPPTEDRQTHDPHPTCARALALEAQRCASASTRASASAGEAPFPSGVLKVYSFQDCAAKGPKVCDWVLWRTFASPHPSSAELRGSVLTLVCLGHFLLVTTSTAPEKRFRILAGEESPQGALAQKPRDERPADRGQA